MAVRLTAKLKKMNILRAFSHVKWNNITMHEKMPFSSQKRIEIIEWLLIVPIWYENFKRMNCNHIQFHFNRISSHATCELESINWFFFCNAHCTYFNAVYEYSILIFSLIWIAKQIYHKSSSVFNVSVFVRVSKVAGAIILDELFFLNLHKLAWCWKFEQ